MAHIRSVIRDAVAAALTGLPTTGDRVYPSRTFELQDEHLPGLRIYTNDDQVEGVADEGTQQRTIQLVVECCSKKLDGMDDELDQMILEVEEAIAENQNLGGASYIDLTGVQVEMEGEAERDVGVARVNFDVVVFTERAEPDEPA